MEFTELQTDLVKNATEVQVIGMIQNPENKNEYIPASELNAEPEYYDVLVYVKDNDDILGEWEISGLTTLEDAREIISQMESIGLPASAGYEEL